MPDKYLYLVINLLTILLPFSWSFERRVSYYKKWRYLFPAMLITAGIFIVWDVWFTNMGVWGFNPRYLTGVYIFNLPLEEVMFFFCIPFSCVFIYEIVAHYKLNFIGARVARLITLIMAVCLFTLGFANIGNYYTAYTFVALAAFLILLLVLKVPYLGKFYTAYLIILIPFFIVNGVLTGSGIENEIVWYNDAENLGIRMFTIPIEDTFYGMLLILMNVSLMQWFIKPTLHQKV